MISQTGIDSLRRLTSSNPVSYTHLEAIRKKLGKKKPELLPLNEEAFNRGLEIGKAARK